MLVERQVVRNRRIDRRDTNWGDSCDHDHEEHDYYSYCTDAFGMLVAVFDEAKLSCKRHEIDGGSWAIDIQVGCRERLPSKWRNKRQSRGHSRFHCHYCCLLKGRPGRGRSPLISCALLLVPTRRMIHQQETIVLVRVVVAMMDPPSLACCEILLVAVAASEVALVVKLNDFCLC